jgi:hypothetical protein
MTTARSNAPGCTAISGCATKSLRSPDEETVGRPELQKDPRAACRLEAGAKSNRRSKAKSLRSRRRKKHRRRDLSYKNLAGAGKMPALRKAPGPRLRAKNALRRAPWATRTVPTGKAKAKSNAQAECLCHRCRAEDPGATFKPKNNEFVSSMSAPWITKGGGEIHSWSAGAMAAIASAAGAARGGASQRKSRTAAMAPINCAPIK